MKQLFPGHFKESEESLKAVWQDCIFVFDANILLNLYRYSDSARDEFLNLIEKNQDRVWLPHRAAEEYLNNRLAVIGQQEKSYDETVSSIKSLKASLDNARQHPFVSKRTMKKVESVFIELERELENNKAVHTKRISNDEIKQKISSVFDERVGSPYSEEKLKEIISKGEHRYKQKIPPGFKDSSKSGDGEVFIEKCRKYGDLIVWMQVIDKSKESKKPIVLVTDDKKDDWWERFRGKTVGPRPELVKEFKEETENSFYMYQADKFLELARENLNEKVSDEILEEIREVRRRDLDELKRVRAADSIKKQQHHLILSKEKSRHLHYQLRAQEEQLKALEHKLMQLEQERAHLSKYREHMIHEGGDLDERESWARQYEMIVQEQTQIEKSRENLQIERMANRKNLHNIQRELAEIEQLDLGIESL